MRTYFLYVLTGVITFWTVLFLFGVSAGFANYAPILAVIGSCLLFSLASPALLLNRRIGLIVGVVCFLMILPFDIGFTLSIFNDGGVNLGTFLAFIPIILILISLIYTIKDFKSGNVEIVKPLKVTLVSIPILLFILYIAFYGKYWSWEMFKIH